MPTDYSGVAELGIISGTGMVISLLVTLTIGPALLRYFPRKLSTKANTKSAVGKVLELSLRWHRLTYAITFVALVAALAILPRVTFDYNLLNMQAQNGEAIQTFKELLADTDNSPWHATALASGREEAERLAQQLAKLPEVTKVVTIFDLVPAEQEEKLSLIEEMALTMGPITNSAQARPAGGEDQISQRKSLQTLAVALDRFIAERPDHPASASARALKASLAALFVRLDAESTDERSRMLQSVEADLLATLPSALQKLRIATEAVPFDMQDLPESISSRWESRSGEYRVAVYPTEDLNDNDALRRFVRAVQQVAPNATGAPMVSLEAGEAVVQAFIQAFLLALAGIIAALLIILRSIKYTLLVLTPLLLSSLFTAAFTVVLNVPFNFANIIALPLLLGLGIDSSLHMVHRSLNNEMVSEVLIHTSTARAIFYSALTALVDFASLMFSSHEGTASMGIMLTVGLTFTLLCTLVILPILLKAPAQSIKV
jgi:hopanoid biosynthesis associated RND transporter like protein HpnN